MSAAKTKKSTKSKRKKKAAKKSTANSSIADMALPMLGSLLDYTGKITADAFDIVRHGFAMPLYFSQAWSQESYLNTLNPNAKQAMQEAGDFLKDARKVAGLTQLQLSRALGFDDAKLVRDVERGKALLPFDMIMRVSSLLARHDPLPFIVKLVGAYNPSLVEQLEDWGILDIPRQFEREHLFLNIYRQNDKLRDLSPASFERFLGYQPMAADFALNVIENERRNNDK